MGRITCSILRSLLNVCGRFSLVGYWTWIWVVDSPIVALFGSCKGIE